jgi:hypothetical protein
LCLMRTKADGNGKRGLRQPSKSLAGGFNSFVQVNGPADTLFCRW